MITGLKYSLGSTNVTGGFIAPSLAPGHYLVHVHGEHLHGEFSYRARNSPFDARNPFASARSPFARYGYEGALSGPLWRDEQFTSESTAPSIVVSGAFEEAGARRDEWRKEPRAEFLESLAATHGSLSIKPGLEARSHPFRNLSADNYGGTYQFASLSAYLANEPSLCTVNAGGPLVIGEQDDLRAV